MSAEPAQTTEGGGRVRGAKYEGAITAFLTAYGLMGGFPRSASPATASAARRSSCYGSACAAECRYEPTAGGSAGQAYLRGRSRHWHALGEPRPNGGQEVQGNLELHRRGGNLWLAYNLKESFRAIFTGALDPDEAGELLDRWVSKAYRSRLAAFVKAARIVRKYREGIWPRSGWASTTTVRRDSTQSFG